MFVLSNLWPYHDYQGDCRRRLLLTGTSRRIWWPGLLWCQLSYSLAASFCCSACFPVFHCRNILCPHQLLTRWFIHWLHRFVAVLVSWFLWTALSSTSNDGDPFTLLVILKLLNFIPRHKSAQVCQCLKASYQMLLPTHCGRFCYTSG